jgi:DNA-binding SARP family transcriptional activator
LVVEGWAFRLLGPLEVRHGGVLVPVTAAKQRVLIAVLALAAGEPVTVDRLTASLWGERPPASARNTLLNYVLRLRHTLQTGTRPCPLVTSSAGYCLDVDADATDVHRFDSLLRQARGDAAAGEPKAALGLLDEALSWWRGEPLVDVPSELLHREVVPRLVEQRLAAQEDRIDLHLRLGRHRELIPELVALTTAHPLRERIWAQLMLALYRCGRTGEALDTYHRSGKLLAEELGLDPGPELQRLHQAILTNDPDLTITDPPPRDPAPPGAAHQRTVPAVVPRQLPAPTGHFVGRSSELQHLSTRLEAASGAPLMVITAIGGTAGIGKTTLAVHWAHQAADRFPDGQLYVNLGGFDPTDTPMPPAIAVRGFLTALGIPAHSIPADPDEQAALYRSQLADRRMLVLLDNAHDAEQVRPLLPGAPGCAVLVTSRNQLGSLVALDGAEPMTLDLLTREEAHELLTRRLGRDHVEREAAVIDELIEACARLPLALNIAAAHAALHPTRPLSQFLEELRDAHRRLDTLTTGEAAADIRAVFSWSYRTLTPDSARVFRLLGLHPGPDIDPPATASLTALDPDRTRRALDELTRAHLITERPSGRYTLHDLLRTYAADRAHAQNSDAERDEALRRVIDHYLHTAHTADQLLDSGRPALRLDPPAPGTHTHPLPDLPAAMAWFDLEYPNLLAAQQTALSRGWHSTVWQLAWALSIYQIRQGHHHDRLTVWRAALDAGAHLPDPTNLVRAHRSLGNAHIDLERHGDAIGHLHRALALAEDLRDPIEQAHTYHQLARAWAQRDDRQALMYATRALDLYRALNEPRWEAMELNTVGWFAACLGDFGTARTHCEASLALSRNHRETDSAACALDSLGYIDHRTGHHQQAIDHYQQALTLFRDVGNTYQSATTLDNLGRPHAALGEHEQARAVWQEALEMYRQQGRGQDADRVQRRLDTLNHPNGR